LKSLARDQYSSSFVRAVTKKESLITLTPGHAHLFSPRSRPHRRRPAGRDSGQTQVSEFVLEPSLVLML